MTEERRSYKISSRDAQYVLEEIRDAGLKEGPDADYTMVENKFSGTITFNENGDRVSADYEVWKVVKEDDQYTYERIKVISL